MAGRAERQHPCGENHRLIYVSSASKHSETHRCAAQANKEQRNKQKQATTKKRRVTNFTGELINGEFIRGIL